VDKVKEYLLDQRGKDPALHGKWTKNLIDLPRHLLTSIPAEAQRNPEVKKDGAILITQSIRERDDRKNKILGDLKARRLYKKDNISYRKGCVNFDEIIDNWRTWYPLESDRK